ncbi:MAG: alpha/beta hydrolase [Leptolyngbyaceae cyanobacterium SM2_5_2]|nr:alpha/beta hydrolase [Leptolyngbyaceae cyanobacterium SM2_5_2]
MKTVYRFLLIAVTAIALNILQTLPLWGQTPNPPPPTAALGTATSGTYESVACGVLVTSPFGAPGTPFPQGATEGTDYECGYLTVPELHAQPDGNTIQVGIVILKSLQPNPAEPLVMFQGGPGGSSIDIFAGMFANATYDERTEALLQNSDNEVTQRVRARAGAALAQLLRRDRDLIIFEKRGNRYSKPELTCARDNGTAVPNDELEALRECRDRLTAKGINLAAYNSVESARDVAALIDTLGYDQVNLYGVSYGTTLVQHIMRLYPNRIRSIILDGIVPRSA